MQNNLIKNCAVLENMLYLMNYPTNRAEIYRVANRHIEEQFFFFEFCLETLARLSKMAYKMAYGKNLICPDYKLMLYALVFT